MELPEAHVVEVRDDRERAVEDAADAELRLRHDVDLLENLETPYEGHDRNKYHSGF